MNASAQKIQPGAVCRVPYSTGRFGGNLVWDWSHGVPGAMKFFPPRKWQDVCAEIDSKKYPRAELAAVLEQSGKKLGAPETSLQNARALKEPKTYAVVTGQQAGFLGGPLLTVHKALTAVKLAQQYEREANGAARFVPVFWIAGDDHDLDEINHAWFLGDDGSPLRVAAPIKKDHEGRSACDVHLMADPEGARKLIGELRPYLGENEAQSSIQEYASRNLEEAFASILLKWLGTKGLVVACSSAMRRFGSTLLQRNLDDYDVVARLVLETGAAMTACGYEPGFSEKLRVAPHFFIKAEDGTRAAIRVEALKDGAKFHAGRRGYSRSDLRNEIERRPELFSASAVLRPILQDSIFPASAVVLGPGEIAYWAQLKRVHEHYGVPWPVIVPRASLTIVDQFGEKAVRKIGLVEKPFEIFRERDELVRMASADGELPVRIEARKVAMMKMLDELGAEVGASEPGQLPMLAKIREKLEYELNRFSERVGVESGKRGEAKALRAQYLAGLVSPRNLPQERVLCSAQFMSRHPGLAERLLKEIEPDVREHLIVTLGEGER